MDNETIYKVMKDIMADALVKFDNAFEQVYLSKSGHFAKGDSKDERLFKHLNIMH